MSLRERQIVEEALNDLRPYLNAFVEQRVPSRPTERRYGKTSGHRDTPTLLNTMLDEWYSVFSRELPPVVKSYVHELRDIRNRWAHEEPFSKDDAERAVDTVRQLAKAIGVKDLNPLKAIEIRSSPIKKTAGRSQREVMREVFLQYGPDPERVIAEYAAAECRGVVARKSNSHAVSPEAYARALLSDGIKKGWL